MRQGRFLTGSLRRGGPLPYGRGSETPGGGAFQQAAQSVMHPVSPSEETPASQRPALIALEAALTVSEPALIA